jgi:hypothetical protein
MIVLSEKNLFGRSSVVRSTRRIVEASSPEHRAISEASRPAARARKSWGVLALLRNTDDFPNPFSGMESLLRKIVGATCAGR